MVIDSTSTSRQQGATSRTFDRRYAVFDPQTNVFSYYSNERDARIGQGHQGVRDGGASLVLYPDMFEFPQPEGGEILRVLHRDARGAHDVAGRSLQYCVAISPRLGVQALSIYFGATSGRQHQRLRRLPKPEFPSSPRYTDSSGARTPVTNAIRRLAPKMRCEGQKLVEFEGADGRGADDHGDAHSVEDSKFFDVAVESREARRVGRWDAPTAAELRHLGVAQPARAASRNRRPSRRCAPRARARRAPRVHLLRLFDRGVGAARGRAVTSAREVQVRGAAVGRKRMFEFASSSASDRAQVQEEGVAPPSSSSTRRGRLSASSSTSSCVESEALQQ